MRVHKARENHDGSFSIGKTWMLDDLSAIQSYNAWNPSTPTEQQQKQWASNLGFTVTIQKPYYWHAKSPKEKDFFIGSLLKIYRKYTGGKVPSLIGFDERERQMLAGGAQASKSPGQPGTPPEGAVSPPKPPFQGGRPQSPYTRRAPSGEEQKEPRRHPSEERIRAQRSREQMRRPSPGKSPIPAMPPPLAPPQFPPPAPPQDQQTQPRSRSGDRGDARTPKTPIMAPESKDKEFSTPSELPKAKPFGHSGSNSLASSQHDLSLPPSRDGKAVPELRPPLSTQNSAMSSPEFKRSPNDELRPVTSRSISSDNRNITQSPPKDAAQRHRFKKSSGNISTEALSQSRENVAADGAVDDHPTETKDDTNVDDTSTAADSETTTTLPAHEEAPSETPSEATAITSQTSQKNTLEPAEEGADAHRPGLGPMVKQKSGKDVVGAFRKAANAYSAFRPRPGGAGERLMAAKKQRDAGGPDGITGVVPAPSLLRTDSEPTPPETTDKEVPSPVTSPPQEPPTVEVTQPTGEVPSAPTTEPQPQERDTSRAAIKSEGDATIRAVSPSPQGGRRKRRLDNTFKYCEALGIDPNVLDGRGAYFDDILTDIGWSGRLSDDRRIEDLEADVRREIGRVEATSWLGNLEEQQESKVDNLAKLIDRTIDECEELDGLLTLYSHELNVSQTPAF